MKLVSVLSFLAVAFHSLPAAAETVRIRLDQPVRGDDRILLRQELARQGYDSRDYDLQAVSVVAEGKGEISLVVGGDRVDSKRLRIDGVPTPNGGYRVNLVNRRGWNSDGPWQLHFGPQAEMTIRRLVVELNRKGFDRPFPNPRETVYSVRLESFANGFLNTRWEAPRGERIVGMSLVRQHSNDRCELGRSYDYSSYEASVSRGCRGTFEIRTVRDRF
jgi:hypothetical protein